MTRYLIVLLAGFVLAVGAEVLAHHSLLAATYIENQSVTIEGATRAVSCSAIRSSFVHINVTEKDGDSIVRYVVEWGSPTQLGRPGCDQRHAEDRRPRDHQWQPRA